MGYSEESWEVKATMFHCQQSKHRCLIISLYDGNQNQRATEFTIKNFFTQEFWDLTQHVRFFFHHKVQAKWIWSQKFYSEYIIHITFLAVCSRLQNSPGENGRADQISIAPSPDICIIRVFSFSPIVEIHLELYYIHTAVFRSDLFEYVYQHQRVQLVDNHRQTTDSYWPRVRITVWYVTISHIPLHSNINVWQTETAKYLYIPLVCACNQCIISALGLNNTCIPVYCGMWTKISYRDTYFPILVYQLD